MRKSGSANVDAMLRHLACHHDPQDFPSTAYERLALIEAAAKRRLIEWQKDRRRYELTPIGWRRLRRNRRLGLTSLAISAVIGATTSAAALAILWLPTDLSHRSVGERAALSSQFENAGVLSPALPPPSASTLVTPPAVALDTAPGVAPNNPVEPATVAEQPVPKQPDGEGATSVVKQAIKKSRHKMARALAFANRYRDERYAGSRLFRQSMAGRKH